MKSHRGTRAVVLLLLSLATISGCQGRERTAMKTEAHEEGHAGGEHAQEGEEGVVTLEPEAIEDSAIETGRAGPRRIEVLVETTGEVRMNAERVVDIRPRFPGAVRQLTKALGDHVRRGEVIASVHSNESLAEYAITSPLSGSVVAREAAVGQAVDHADRLYTIADLSTVWIDFAIYPQNVGAVRRGQKVRIVSEAGVDLSAEGVIHYVGPLLEQDTRVSYGRVILPNSQGRWQPGLYVNAIITVSEASAPVAVPEEAIVRLPGGPAVFRAAGNTFRAQLVVTGRSDGTFTEVVQGLEAGAPIVVKNAFLLKAELGKSEASHDH